MSEYYDKGAFVNRINEAAITLKCLLTAKIGLAELMAIKSQLQNLRNTANSPPHNVSLYVERTR